MKTGDRGRTLIKEFEGRHLKAYQDPVGIWTIGFGHTGRVKPGQVITPAEAEALLVLDLAHADACVNSNVSVAIAQAQFDALTSFVYNLGCGAFRRSTLLRLINAGEMQAAADQFPRWNKAGGNVLRGLTRRREAERRLFLEGVL
jgi:lysozyme